VFFNTTIDQFLKVLSLCYQSKACAAYDLVKKELIGLDALNDVIALDALDVPLPVFVVLRTLPDGVAGDLCFVPAVLV